MQRKKFIVGVFLSVALLLVTFLFFYEPSSPEGIYFDKNIACRHGCWIFKGGNVSVQCDEGSPQNAGLYHKSGNQWLWGNNPTNVVLITPSLFGLKVIGAQFQGNHQFWPRDCFSRFID